ncbi:hypothetical protein [Paenirhodobacter populi]|uniref:hypothetical protein n=1 Tax=Paenirhodobacter populi TaxID=2306993 RepID=UPI000FE362ED|nr:hypothetical protein [Sinirhodobacter populi]RWR09783.1 hypothetical protein D2T32_05430 [Sinirhodobacter populi]
MGTVPDGEPLVKYHDLDGPLQGEFYAALGLFIHRFTEAEEDIIHSVQSFITASCNKDRGLSALPVISILTAEMPTKYLMDYAEIIAADVRGYTKAQMSKIKKARKRFDDLRDLRNLVSHQAAYFDPFSEIPFIYMRQAAEKRIAKHRTISIGVSVLSAAAADVGQSGYRYRCFLADSPPDEEQEPTWRYKPDMLIQKNLHRS